MHFVKSQLLRLLTLAKVRANLRVRANLQVRLDLLVRSMLKVGLKRTGGSQQPLQEFSTSRLSSYVKPG